MPCMPPGLSLLTGVDVGSSVVWPHATAAKTATATAAVEANFDSLAKTRFEEVPAIQHI